MENHSHLGSIRFKLAIGSFFVLKFTNLQRVEGPDCMMGKFFVFFIVFLTFFGGLEGAEEKSGSGQEPVPSPLWRPLLRSAWVDSERPVGGVFDAETRVRNLSTAAFTEAFLVAKYDTEYLLMFVAIIFLQCR